jgi:hypothetical protein
MREVIILIPPGHRKATGSLFAEEQKVVFIFSLSERMGQDFED